MIKIDKKNDSLPHERLTLSAIIQADSFFYALSAPDGQIKQLFEQSFEFDLDQVGIFKATEQSILSGELSLSGINTVKIAVDSPIFALVPDELLDTNDLKQYFEDLTLIAKNENIHISQIPKLNSSFLYPLSSFVYERLLSKWPNAGVYHYGAVLLEQDLLYVDTNNLQNAILIHPNNGYAYCSVFCKGALQLFNRFSFSTKEDLLYFIVLYLNSASLKPEDVEVIWSGHITDDAQYFNFISMYMPKMNFVQHAKLQNYRELDITRPAHYYYDLLALQNAHH